MYERYMDREAMRIIRKSMDAGKYEGKEAFGRLLVIFSYSDLPEEIRIPKNFDMTKAELLLGSEKGAAAPAEDGLILLKPYEARVYLFHD